MSTKSKIAQVELRPNRRLLDSKFESYKLSLASIPSYKAPISCGVHVVRVGDDNFSYEKTKCLTLHNYLTLDQWHPDNVYFVDSDGCIRRFHVQLEMHIEPSFAVFSFGFQRLGLKSNLPPSLHFASEEICIACDGVRSVYVLHTGDRNNRYSNTWKELYKHVEASSAPFILHSVHRKSTDESNIEYLDCLFLKFVEKMQKTTENGSSDEATETVIEWVSLGKRPEEEKFQLLGVRMFQGKSFPCYASLLQDCSEMHLASDSPFNFIPSWCSDLNADLSLPGELANEETVEDKDAPYEWKQTEEDVTVFIKLHPDVTTKSIAYSLSKTKVSIGVRENEDAQANIILEGDLYLEAEPESSNWTVSDGRLEVTIQKRIEGRTWMTVVDGDNRGKMIVDPEEVERIHKKLEHLTSDTLESGEPQGQIYSGDQLEECDSYYNSSAALVCFNATAEAVTKSADISSTKWLFNAVLDPSRPAAFVLRHDVDAIVWQPSVTGNNTSWHHLATFNALGYVHASKNNLKFCSCAPDTSYAALCDCQRRIYIYRQPTALSSPLRNRMSGEVVGNIATQQVTTLDNNADILGFCTSNSRMFVLMQNELVIFKVSSDVGA
ncbi:nudC domain-containing protein 1 [Ciona intestinalis]